MAGLDMRRARGVVAWIVALGLLAGCQEPPPPESEAPAGPDRILVNGNVYTVDPQRPRAEAVAIVGDRITAVGSTDAIYAMRGDNTEIINLNGHTLVPGFIDAHVHFVGIGERLMRIDAGTANSRQEVAAMVAERAATTPAGEWIVGRGWDQNNWPDTSFPTRDVLDAVAPDHPVFLRRVDGHAGWANSLALERAGIAAETPDPVGGEIIRDADGEPTGTLIDNAFRLVTRNIPPMTRTERIQAVELAIQQCLSMGVTSVQEAGSHRRDLEVYEEMLSTQDFDLRLFAFLRWPANESMRPYDYEDLDAYLQRGPRRGLYGHRFTIGGVKMSIDGALGSRGAALLEPYSDDPDNTGLFRLTEDEIRSTIERAMQAGFQVTTHAIGDAANRVVLDAMEEAIGTLGAEDHRLRIEHAQILHPDDVGRFAELGVIPSMQPSHATTDMKWAAERLGEERTRYAYAWASLLRSGARIPGGSDAPVEPVDPLFGIYAAVTRQDADGWPEGGWHPEQRVTREQALRMFTIDAAWSVFEDDVKGSISPGKLADMVVLSEDIMTVEPSGILDTSVIATFLAGEMVYQRNASADLTIENAAEQDAAPAPDVAADES